MNRDFESHFYLFSKSSDFNKKLKEEIDSQLHNFIQKSVSDIDNDKEIKLSKKHYILAKYLNSLL